MTDGIGVVMNDMMASIDKRNAEIASLRAELAKSEDWIRVLQKTHGINNELSEERRSEAARQDAETIARLQDKLTDARNRLSADALIAELSEDKLRETIARLREALEHCYQVLEGNNEYRADAARIKASAALAHLPQEEPR